MASFSPEFEERDLVEALLQREWNEGVEEETDEAEDWGFDGFDWEEGA